MAGPVPTIHVLFLGIRKTWMPGTSPRMTARAQRAPARTKQIHLSNSPSQCFAARVLRGAGYALSLFPSPATRGDGAPGGARVLARHPWRILRGSAARLVRTRAPSDVGRCASRRSTAALVGAAPRSAFRIVSGDALAERGRFGM